MKTPLLVLLVLGMPSAVSLAEQAQKPPDDRRLGAPRSTDTSTFPPKLVDAADQWPSATIGAVC